MRQDYERFQGLDTEIIVIGPENAKSFESYWKDNELPFIGLPDPEHNDLRRYGQEVKLLKLGRMPAQMLIDKSGILRYAYYGNSMSDIPSNDQILRLIRKDLA